MSIPIRRFRFGRDKLPLVRGRAGAPKAFEAERVPTNSEITLDLHGTRITDAGLVHLEGLHNLRHVYLGNTQVTDKGRQELSHAIQGSSHCH